MEPKANEDLIQKLMEYHKWWVENKLSVYEKIASKLWPPTGSFLDSLTPVFGTQVEEEEKDGKKYTTLSFTQDTLLTNVVLLEGLVLHLTAIWEGLVTNTIVVLFAQDTSNYSRRFDYRLEKTMNVHSVDLARAIVIGDRYLDFRNFDYIKSIERKFLAQNLRPFSHISDGIQKSIDEMYILRNHVAHQSEKSRRDYREKVLVKYKIEYTSSDIPVGEFLLSSPPPDDKNVPKILRKKDIGLFFDSSGRKRIFEIYIDALKNASEEVVEYLEKELGKKSKSALDNKREA